MLTKKTTREAVRVNNALLNIITPMGFEIKRNSLVIGENTGKVYGIVKYPQKVDFGWLAKLTNIPGTIVSISFTPIDNGAFIESLSRSVIQSRGTAESAKDPLVQKRAERAAKDGERIMVQIDQNGETVGLMGITIMPISRDEELFNKVCRKTESVCAIAKCKPRGLANLQEQAFKTLSPFYTREESIDQIVQRIIPLSSFVGGFPFSSSGYNDRTGYYFGRDTSGGLIVVDPWKRGNDRTNTNFTIMGVAGVGKSTAVKHIALSEYMKGTKIIFIDPEREYKELCEALNGDWINAGGGIIGEYSNCSYRLDGEGTFKGSDNSNPSIGEKGKYERVIETRLEVLVDKWKLEKVIREMIKAHPYEEVAYDVYPLANKNVNYGMGAMGELEKPMKPNSFLEFVRMQLGGQNLRYAEGKSDPLKKIAVCGGSGADLLSKAIAVGADAFVTADVKYHTFQDAEDKIYLIDAGHYETEIHSLNFVRKKLDEFIKARKSSIKVYKYTGTTNPVKFL